MPQVNEAFQTATAPADLFSERDLQARHGQLTGLGGSLAQSDALPSVKPAGIASGTISAAGSEAGEDAIVALGLNPSILFLADEASAAMAKYSRFADLSLLIPVSGLDQDDDGKLDYAGVRLRINVTGLSAGDAIWAAADSLFRSWIAGRGLDQERMKQLFRRTPNLERCAIALAEVSPTTARISQACGEAFEAAVDLGEAEQLRDALAAIRDKADSRYFGADIRFDFGDPTLGAVDNSSGTFMFAGISYGRRYETSSGQSRYGFRALLGGRYASLDDTTATDVAVEGGFGFDFARRFEEQEISGGAALEFRYSNEDDPGAREALQTDFLAVRASLLIPISAVNSVTIAIRARIIGEVSSSLSVNFNWGLLYPGRPRS